jgi:hypothetical protein
MGQGRRRENRAAAPTCFIYHISGADVSRLLHHVIIGGLTGCARRLPGDIAKIIE